jgi:polyhydroxyalkanoate synthase
VKLDADGDLPLAVNNGLEVLDRRFNSTLGRFTKGISPAALSYSFLDWLQHLTLSPGKQTELILKAYRKAYRFAKYGLQSLLDPMCEECIAPLPQDTRFDSSEWKRWPYNLIYQGFLLNQQWWHGATTDVRGVSKHHSEVVTFAMRQILDMLAPSNFIPTNPNLGQITLFSCGFNLVKGMWNYLEDERREYRDEQPVGAEDFQPGKTVAVTPGKVVFRNRLIELIQYKPTTKKVYTEPILIIPAWIMKYYILDLSPQNSLVKYLVNHGHTVFMISWKNPTSEDRDLSMEDYLKLGIMEAMKAVEAITGHRSLHCAGYCIGGALLAIAASAMSRDNDHRLKSVTLFTTQTDYTESGELGLFIDESQITFLEDVMWRKGYLDSKQVTGAFQLLRSKDLIYSKSAQSYLIGKREPMIDLMAWNADSTRLPFRMHSEYLRKLYLNNDLAEGRFNVKEHPITLHDIRVPVFCVATVKDHVSPWRSVYKINLLTETEVTFVLTSGGHNAGIVSEPGHPRRNFIASTSTAKERYLDPDTWIKDNPKIPGSWWPHWINWLKERSTDKKLPPPMGKPKSNYRPLYDAPGKYVFER